MKKKDAKEMVERRDAILYCQGRRIDDRGVRPSSGAARPDCAGAAKFSKADLLYHVAAPGDGRTPPL